MQSVSVKELIDAGIHFGCKSSQWNPKMKKFIHGKKNNIHIIDVEETLRGLIRAQNFLAKLAETGAQVLFVGTKRQIQPVIQGESKRCEMPYVIERWIGGTLTNYAVIRKRLQRLEELEQLETSGDMERKYSKKIISSLRRERAKIARNLEGIRTMNGVPGAIVVIDPKREHIAVREAKRMAVPTICLLDTDCNPDFADIAIPGNDDAMKSVRVIVSQLADSVAQGRETYRMAQVAADREAENQEEARVATPSAPNRKDSRAKKAAVTAAENPAEA